MSLRAIIVAGGFFLLASGLQAAPSAGPVPSTASASYPSSPKSLWRVPHKITLFKRGPVAINFGGLYQFWGVWERSAEDSLRIRRLETKLYGDLLPWLHFEAMIDPAKRIPRGFDKSIIQNLYVDLDLLFLPAKQILRLGEFKIPITEEGFRSPSKLETIDTSLVARSIRDNRDVGGMLLGDFKYGIYQFGIFKGEGQNNGRNHDRKDLELRMVGKPLVDHPDWGSLEAGWTGYWRRSSEALPDRKRLGVEVRYEKGPGAIKHEIFLAQTGATLVKGWYIQPSWYFIPKKLQGVFKFESFDPNRRKPLDIIRESTFGLNYFVDGNWEKIQLNWVHKDEQGPNRANDLLLLALQINF